jgi:VWFA-related protein
MKSLCFLGCLTLAMAQTQTTPPPSSPNPPEMNTREEPTAASFRSHTNLVMVPAVARDVHGNVVGDLTKANFTLYDKGKLQEITRFTKEKVGNKTLTADSTPADPAAPGTFASTVSDEKGPAVVVPERFVAYFFDDVHIPVGDLPRIREAALRHISGLKPSDRAAIYTMSGFPSLDFTDDQARLNDAIMRLRLGPMVRVGAMGGGGRAGTEMQTLASLDVIKSMIQRMSGAPGQRIIMMISAGFLTNDPLYLQQINEVLEYAVRNNVTISGMDARGLYTDPSLDVSRSGGGGGGRGRGLSPLMRAEMQTDIIRELADGTGGSFFENSNDYDEGFRRIAAAPEYVYMLGFTPQNLKNDGSFHPLRVVVKQPNGLTIQARRGYYAPNKLADAEETARVEIGNALYSREDLQELPIDLHTQFFKVGGNTARLAVLLRLDLKLFKYQKLDGRNYNLVTMVTGIFDRDGNFVQGIKKTLELHLKDDTLATKLNKGAVIKTNFDLAPGTYLVRQVVRDAQGQQMSATNAAVVIPQ